ncbi:ABC transporter [Hirsutella rhossiliensis]|uniref:ABC transporter domain-containing protein n=1 Tax=Hirsutella rhossiliensis TaxID=111463 RepID=A0A9P8N286_9HYPO|nr:ABC transporter domain-containing protein [Hirsutella rhossiliensis]KAH0965550.1 ABC transporter domain-containing protein [Hirsutella rhossiliensis]
MDVAILRLGSYESSPFRSIVGAYDPPRRPPLSSLISTAVSQVPWIRRLSRFSQSGILQAVILAVSLACVAVACLSRHRNGRPGAKPKASSIPWRFELLSQASRAAALTFLAVAYVRRRTHWPSLVLLVYLFVLGLLRLSRHLQWRQAALHQVNFVTVASLAMLVATHFLPCVQTGIQCTIDPSILGAAASLLVALVLAMFTPRAWVLPQIDDHDDTPGLELPGEPTLEETCSWINYYCTYEWLTPVIWKGTTGKLDMSGIPKLAWYDEPLYLLRKVQVARSISKTTLWTTLRFQRVELLLMSLWVGCSYIVENIAPFAMFRLLQYLDAPADAVYHPWVWLILMFSGPVCRSILYQQYIFTSTRLIVRIKSAMTQELYHKALQSMEIEDDPFQASGDKAKPDNDSDKAQKSTSAGRLANLMAADVDAIFRARDMIIVLVGVPSGTVISLIGLYKMLGWASLVGTFVLFLGVPLSVWFGKMMYGTQKRVRKAQDARISLVTEYLASIRAIKYFAWETPITEKLVAARAVEQKGLWGLAVLQTTINEISHIFPYLALLVLFGLHVGLDRKPLEASTAFTTLYLVKNIRRNIMMASMFSRNFAGALVAFGRLDKYFESTVPLVKYPAGPLRIERGHFRRSKKATFSLRDINLDFVEGGLNVVTGQSGCGKSTLLLAILGETYLEGGSVTAPEDIAFASQSAWLQNETIRDNILFGSPMEEVRYGRVLEACCLPEDLRELPLRDQTAVGENGTSLSGGQKARVALARALYSKAPLLLLDDVFSALDAKTSAGVWKHCFCGDLLRGRTTVLVTQVPWISAQADLSIMLDGGQVKSVDPNIGVVRRPIKIADVLGGGDDDGNGREADKVPEPELQPNGDGFNDTSKVAQDASVRNDAVDQEMKATSKAGRLGMLQYMGYFGHPLFAVVCLVGLLLANVFFFSTTLWLSVWVEAYNHNAHVDVAFYMGIFALLVFSELMSYGVIVIAFEWGSWRAARRLHNDFIRAVMRVPLSWFKAVPVGRITNRFSGDMASIDGALGAMLRASLDTIIQLLLRVGAVSAIMPVFMLPGLAACCVGIVVGEMYTRTAVVIKRLTSSAQSPVFSQFADTLAGLPVIRARTGMAGTFGAELADKLRVWSAASETNYNCNRWVAVRIDLVTALVALSAGIIAVSKVGLVGAGLVGFSLTSANELSQTILMLVRSMNDLEVEMQSFHRVKEYVKLEPEGKDDRPFADQAEGGYTDNDARVIPEGWPCSGQVEFRSVTVRYDPGGPDILSDISLTFRAGQRVAIVGRTGSGKSTLVLSLLRFTDIVSGQILLDGVDITKVPRRRLRESLTIIPQEAVLFSGSVASNLDPTGLASRARLDAALDNCKGIASFSSGGGDDDDDDNHVHGAAAVNGNEAIALATEVHARGDNFSHGQRQVLSLCRALVRDSRLMLLDEATASMDYATDRGIQRVLRAELQRADDDGGGSGRTLVTIAHRLRTIIDYDVVVVMSAGRVLEQGSPKDLYDSRGQFYDMVCHSGEETELREFLEES